MRTNTAYDLSQFAASEQRPRVRVVKTGRDARAAEDKKFLMKLAALTVAVIALAVYTVYSSMLLTKTKAQIDSGSEQLVALQSENAYLDYQIESMVSLSNAQSYAENELGLVKLDTARIEYVNLENENCIVSQGDGSLAGTVATFLNTVMDFLAP